jgi:tRNA (guanosine-2'-O-)-methyltransferase
MPSSPPPDSAAAAHAILRRVVNPARRAKLETVLDRRLGAVRVVVEHLRHAHNMSAVLRTCEALGVQHVHAVERVEDTRVSRRVTLGAHKWLSIHRHDSFAECARELHDRGFALYAAMLRAEALPLEEIPVAPPVALVFGNEKEGVSEAAARLCDGAYTIPMEGFVQSFNVSVAVAISLYSLTRRARALRPDGGRLLQEERRRLLEAWLPKSIRCGRRLASALDAGSHEDSCA